MTRKIIINGLEAECEDWREAPSEIDFVKYDRRGDGLYITFYSGIIKYVELKR